MSDNLIRFLPSHQIKISVGRYDIAAKIYKTYNYPQSFGGDFYIELSKLNFIRWYFSDYTFISSKSMQSMYYFLLIK